MVKAPIALFVFKRPEHTRRVLESLKNNEGIEDSELFIYCDGPKGIEDVESVKAVRHIVKSQKWAKAVHLIEEGKNKGLAASIIDGVNYLVNRYGHVIVLEDDLVLSPQFLNYMNDALRIYADNPSVMHVSGYLLPVSEELPETFFFRGISSWGWATWKRAWKLFEPDSGRLISGFKRREQKRAFDINRSIDFYNMLIDQQRGMINSWAIRWYASVFLNNGLSLYPGCSLVDNRGHDGTGQHCHNTSVYDVQLSHKRIINFEKNIEENKKAVTLIEDFYRHQKIPIHQKIVSLIKEKLFIH